MHIKTKLRITKIFEHGLVVIHKNKTTVILTKQGYNEIRMLELN